MINLILVKHSLRTTLYISIILLIAACTSTITKIEPTAEGITVTTIPYQEKVMTTDIPLEKSAGNSNGGEKPTTIVAAIPTFESNLSKSDIEYMNLTPTISPSPIETPKPNVIRSTVSEEEATQNLIDLLKNNGGCNLPCFWGIIPGKTWVNSVGEIFVPKGFSWYQDTETKDSGAGLSSESSEYKSNISIVEEGGIVQTLEVGGGTREFTEGRNEAWGWYSIPEIVKRYGQPDRVFVLHPFRFDAGVSASYNLYLFYESKGFVIRYHGAVEYLDEPGMVRACPDIVKTDVITLLLYQPDENFNALAHVLPEDAVVFKTPGDNVYEAIAWETVTGLTLDDFYDLFTTEHGESPPCFDFQTYWTS